MRKIFILTILFSVCMIQTSAQKIVRGIKPSKTQIEQIQKKRADYIVKEMELTDAESVIFVPLLNEFMAAKFHTYRIFRDDSRTFKNKKEKSKLDYDAITDKYLDFELRRVALEKDFYTQIRKIFPAEKVYKFRIAEHRYMHLTLDEQRQERD